MEITSYREEFRESVINLLGEGSTQKSEQKAALWDWQYHHNPFMKRAEDIGIVVIEGGKVVGFNGYIPVPVQCDGQLIEGAWSCDTIISPECRGKGYGGILHDAVKVRFPLVMGLGISDIQAQLNRKRGYRVCLDIDGFSYTNKISVLKDVARKGRQCLIAMKSFAKRPPTEGLTARVLDIAALPSQTDLIWRAVSPGFSKIIPRDYAYLKWRYASHPFLKYQLIVVEKRRQLQP